MDQTEGALRAEIQQTTGSEFLQYADGLINVYGDGKGGALLAVRRKPHDIYAIRSIEMTREQAREVGEALLAAAQDVGRGP